MNSSMNTKTKMLYTGLAALLLITGVVVYKSIVPSEQQQVVPEEEVEVLPQVDASVVVRVKESTKANTIVLSVAGLGGKYKTVGYEITYDSEGLIKGVNSGSKPKEVAGEDGFEQEIYLGTCSRNVCKPDVGVRSVSVVLEFTDMSGKRSQFSGDFPL